MRNAAIGSSTLLASVLFLVGLVASLDLLATDARSREEVMATLKDNMSKIDNAMRRAMEQGQDVEPIRTILLNEFRPLMQQGRIHDAEKVQQRVLAMVDDKTTSYATAPSGQDLSKYKRRTNETQYLVFTPEPNDFRELKTLDAIFPEYKRRLRELKQGDKRKWGMSLVLPSWSAPPEALKSFINQAFTLALEYDLAIHFTVESHDWEARPDLWNYAAPNKRGYRADNVNNVEWSDWDRTPFPHRFRDWGTPEKMAPVICYNSKRVLDAVTEIVQGTIGPALNAGMNKLKKAGKDSLFAGVTVGSEPDLPNYEDVEHFNPRMAKMMDDLKLPKTRLGYCALTNLGYSKNKLPKDFAKALAEVNRSYTVYWARKLHEAGIPSLKMYTHLAAGAGVVGSAAVKHTNAPIDIAFNDYALPGWTTYPNGPLKDDFSLLYKTLAEHGNPHWGGTEANPQGLELRGMRMDEYLDRHYEYGATLVVMNIGATSNAMMSRLRAAVWSSDAIRAYKGFLGGS